MEEQQVAALLISDVTTYFAWFQFGVLFIVLALIIVSMILAIRAYTALSEARVLFAQASHISGESGPHTSQRVATAEAINAASRAKKMPSERGRTLP